MQDKEIPPLAPSRTIFVLKRDGTFERFDRHKLCACLLRAMPPREAERHWAGALSEAILCYLARRGLRCVTSAAVFEIALTALRAAGRADAARSLERQHTARVRLRGRLTVDHDGQVETAWSKDWLVRLARSRWGLGRTAARILAGDIEQGLLGEDVHHLTRRGVRQRIAYWVAAYGLDDRPALSGILPR